MRLKSREEIQADTSTPSARSRLKRKSSSTISRTENGEIQFRGLQEVWLRLVRFFVRDLGIGGYEKDGETRDFVAQSIGHLRIISTASKNAGMI